MSHQPTDNEAGALLGRHRLASPTPELEARVLQAAREAWAAAKADEVPWTTPLLRLAACAALAALPALFAEGTRARPGGRQSASSQAAVRAGQDQALDGFWAMTGRPDLFRIASAVAPPRRADAKWALAACGGMLSELLEGEGGEGGLKRTKGEADKSAPDGCLRL